MLFVFSGSHADRGLGVFFKAQRTCVTQLCHCVQCCDFIFMVFLVIDLAEILL